MCFTASLDGGLWSCMMNSHGFTPPPSSRYPNSLNRSTRLGPVGCEHGADGFMYCPMPRRCSATTGRGLSRGNGRSGDNPEAFCGGRRSAATMESSISRPRRSDSAGTNGAARTNTSAPAATHGASRTYFPRHGRWAGGGTCGWHHASGVTNASHASSLDVRTPPRAHVGDGGVYADVLGAGRGGDTARAACWAGVMTGGRRIHRVSAPVCMSSPSTAYRQGDAFSWRTTARFDIGTLSGKWPHRLRACGRVGQPAARYQKGLFPLNSCCRGKHARAGHGVRRECGNTHP